MEGQGINRLKANRTALSSAPTLVLDWPQEHDSAVRLPHTGFCNRPFLSCQPCAGVSLGLDPAPAWKCPCLGLCQSLGEGGSLASSRQLSHFTLPSSLPWGKVWQLLRKQSMATLPFVWEARGQCCVAPQPPAKQGKNQDCFANTRAPREEQGPVLLSLRSDKWE